MEDNKVITGVWIMDVPLSSVQGEASELKAEISAECGYDDSCIYVVGEPKSHDSGTHKGIYRIPSGGK